MMKYEIKGGNLPVVICTLQSGEAMITESGAMSWMSSNMKMETGAKGGLGGAFGRMFSGESIFQNRYTAHGGEGMIAFASCFPGEIRAVEITPRTQPHRAKARFPRLHGGRESIRILPEEVRHGSIRRRRLHHAEAIRKRNGVFGD